jgi:BASS family bile acid:Na+ symporter
MEALKAWLPLLVLLSIGLMVLAIGLGAALEHALYLFRRPGQLLRAVVAMYVVVPVVATVVVKSLHLDSLVALAIVLMSVSPVPPILPVAQRKVGGRQPYVEARSRSRP